MSKFGKPRLKKMRRVGSDISLFSGIRPLDTKGKINTRPGMQGAKRIRFSDYAINLRSKQVVRYTYGISNTQLLHEHLKAVARMRALRRQGKEADYGLLEKLESRLDVVVYRMGFAPTIAAARQLVVHRKIFVDGHRQSKPLFSVNPGSVVEVRVEETQKSIVEGALDFSIKHTKASNWVSVLIDPKGAAFSWTLVKRDSGMSPLFSLKGTVIRKPTREEDLPSDLLERESEVIQFYSK